LSGAAPHRAREGLVGSAARALAAHRLGARSFRGRSRVEASGFVRARSAASGAAQCRLLASCPHPPHWPRRRRGPDARLRIRAAQPILADPMTTAMRPSKRAADEMRKVTLERGVARYAEGSCLIAFGETKVLCAATLEDRPPPWL